MQAHRKYRLGLLLALSGICVASQGLGFAQSAPLTDQQVDKLRESAIDPDEKVKLYLGFIEDRTNEIHRLNAASKAQSQDARIHNLYEEFTQLSDELEDNLDSFDQQHADMRKTLKTVVEDSEKWLAVLNEPKADTEDDFVRKAALAAVESVHDDCKQMLEDQEKYFAQKKTGKSGGS
jgi:hypothetical protein